jgi:hypothetical protein
VNGSARLATILLLLVEGAWAAAPPGVPPPVLKLDTLCTELASWQSKLSDRALSPAGRASAASTAWIVPMGNRLGLAIPRAAVVELMLEATLARLDTAVLQLAGDPPRLVMFSLAAAEGLGARWFEGGPSYYELLAEAMTRHGERRACSDDHGALVRAALAEMVAATFLRVAGEGEVYLRDRSHGYLVRERTRYDDGTAQLDWNAVLPRGPAPEYLLVHWQMSDDDVLAMAPAATGPSAADAADAQPAWVAALGAALVRRDANAMIELSVREGWNCRLRQPGGAPLPCPPAPNPDRR